jgi:hypothetical protein
MHLRAVRKTRLTILLGAAVVGTGALGQSVPPAVVQLGLHSGDQAPGLPAGFTLYWISPPVIDFQGNLGCSASLDGPEVHLGNGGALFYGPPGGMSKFLWESEQCPGMASGVVLGPGLRDCMAWPTKAGWWVLNPKIAGPGITEDVNDRVVLVGPPGDLVLVMQAGDQALGCEPGVYTDPRSFGGWLTDDGTEEGEHWLLVCADLAGAGVTLLNDHACWAGTRDNLQLIYRKGMPAPGCGWMFGNMVDPIISDAGQVAFFGDACGGGRWIGGPDWSGADPLTMLVHDDFAVPTMPEFTWRYSAQCHTELNVHGRMLEAGSIRGPGVTTANDRVLFYRDDSGYHLMHREGDPVPSVGPDVTVSGFGGCWINNRDEAIYGLIYAGPGITEANKRSVWFGPLGATSQSLRDNDPAPTFGPDVLISVVGAVSAFAAMNDVGDVVGPSLIVGPGITDEDNVILWLRHHVLQRWAPLLRGGSALGPYTVFAPDESDFGYAYGSGTGGADGRAQSLNDIGQLAMRLEFTDGTHGVFRITPGFGDMDRDGDVDEMDFSEAASCWAGPDRPLPRGCEAMDLDGDGDLDLADQALFQQLLTD